MYRPTKVGVVIVVVAAVAVTLKMSHHKVSSQKKVGPMPLGNRREVSPTTSQDYQASDHAVQINLRGMYDQEPRVRRNGSSRHYTTATRRLAGRRKPNGARANNVDQVKSFMYRQVNI